MFSLHWAGPAASQAGVRIDGIVQPQPIPSRGAIVGLLGAGLGYRVGDPRLQQLADDLKYAVVVHKAGHVVIDFQTADLGRLPESTWFLDGERLGVMERTGGETKAETYIQRRPLHTDVDMTVIVETSHLPAEEILSALDRPRFPLCLGRENCPPGGRVAGEVLEGSDMETIALELRKAADDLMFLPVEHFGWGEQIIEIPSRLYGHATFTVKVAGDASTRQES